MKHGAWLRALRQGILRWSASTRTRTVAGVDVEWFAPRAPILFCSGATPGPFYHSHPHDPSEFDHLPFDMSSQARANIATIEDIIDAVSTAPLPFALPSDLERKETLFVNWVSRNGEGFEANAAATADAFAEAGLEDRVLGVFEVGGNVSDRRFLLETFAMLGLVGSSPDGTSCITRVDLTSQFDAVSPDGSIYTVGEKEFFMPYVPGYVVSGEGSLVLFSLTAASGERSAPADGAAQVRLVVEKLQRVLAELGATFDDVVLLWNRCAELDAIEEAVLMTRARDFGLTRPLAEAVLEIVDKDPNPAPDGTASCIEYIVVAKLPR